MPTIDLSTPPPPSTGLLDALPRRVALTLPELRLVAERAGDAPLPFDVRDPVSGSSFDGRLGESRGTAEDSAYAGALAALHDPATSLERRGLLGDGGQDEGLLGAVGLLATPSTAVDIDVSAAGIHARSWHRQTDDAVATLSTVDGIVFEIAWFASAQWPQELARVAEPPADTGLRGSEVPPYVDLPYELADASAEAIRSGRADLVPVLAAQHAGSVVGADDQPYSESDVASILGALSAEAQGRLRALVADVSGDQTAVVGVVSWTLLADGWHALRPRRAGDDHRVAIGRVDPSDLAGELAPVLAEVTG